MDSKVVNLLLIEDDMLDIMDMQRTLDKLNILYKISIARNGEEAIENLQQREGKEPMPDIVLLDINMPKMNGMEFLSSIRVHDKYKELKVFVITTSDERVDREAVKKLGVSGYIVKPLKLNNPSSMDAFNLMIDLMNMKSGF